MEDLFAGIIVEMILPVTEMGVEMGEAAGRSEAQSLLPALHLQVAAFMAVELLIHASNKSD